MKINLSQRHLHTVLLLDYVSTGLQQKLTLNELEIIRNNDLILKHERKLLEWNICLKNVKQVLTLTNQLLTTNPSSFNFFSCSIRRSWQKVINALTWSPHSCVATVNFSECSIFTIIYTSSKILINQNPIVVCKRKCRRSKFLYVGVNRICSKEPHIYLRELYLLIWPTYLLIWPRILAI